MRLLVLWEAVSFCSASYATREACLAYPGYRSCRSVAAHTACDPGFAAWLFFACCLWTYFFFPLCIVFLSRSEALRKDEDNDIVLV